MICLYFAYIDMVICDSYVKPSEGTPNCGQCMAQGLLKMRGTSVQQVVDLREYPHKIWPYMVQYLHFRILKFPLIKNLTTDH